MDTMGRWGMSEKDDERAIEGMAARPTSSELSARDSAGASSATRLRAAPPRFFFFLMNVHGTLAGCVWVGEMACELSNTRILTDQIGKSVVVSECVCWWVWCGCGCGCG
jgi:hypothetical protein